MSLSVKESHDSLPALSGRECVRILYRLKFRLGRVEGEAVEMRGPRGISVTVPLKDALEEAELNALLEQAKVTPRHFADMVRRRAARVHVKH
jgi:predicted RNA binding protein YcfA (HicA-like mRNA interferase family)